jgi:F0F1-type ATP synthase membrane subunit b/b'
MTLTTLALTLILSLVAGAFGVLVIRARGKEDQKKEEKIQDLQEDLETIKRIQNVEINTDRAAALERLRSSGHVRKD